tara:strand:+ start:964 stop:1221 length:258 start_codon:yes stop_codon:yes gene_type:complete
MGLCRFCEVENCDTWYGNYCAKCHKLKRVIHLFSIDKVMNIVENVLIVNEEQQEENIKDELKTELTTRASTIRKCKKIKEQKSIE